MQTFDDVLAETADQRRHLLLGNGFSIALFPERFSYGSLLETADFSQFPQARAVFDVLGTTSFELVIRALAQARDIGPIYNVDPGVVSSLQSHIEGLKELLVQAVAGKHPARPSEVSESQYSFCRKFLANFAGASRGQRRGNIYSLNYDLLLYWALLHDQVIRWNGSDPLASIFEAAEEIQHDDGFRAPPENYDAPYVTWEGEAIHTQCTFFLHGALHLFDYGFELQKICWERTGGTPLVDQVRRSLDEGKFPLFVSEGSSDSKLERIRHSGYLHKGLRSFSEICRKEPAALFVFGHSFDPTDDHILNHIGRGKITRLFVSVFGDEDRPDNRALVARANALKQRRSDRYPLQITFFDAGSARVWG